MKMKTGIMALLAAASLGGCEYLATADRFSQDAVAAVCGQPENARKIEREKLAGWGLWAQCVPAGTRYDGFRLVSAD